MIRPFEPDDRATLIELWGNCGLTRSWNNPDLDIDRKLSVNPDGFLVAVDDDRLVGSVMVGYDGHRGWVNYLAVSPNLRRGGLGRELMAAAEQYLLAKDCPKINLQIRTSNAAAIGFYESIGYTADDVASMGKRLIDDA